MKSTTTKRLSVCRQVHTPRRKGVIVRSYTSSGTLIEECEVAVRYPEPPPMADERYAPPSEPIDWPFWVVFVGCCLILGWNLPGVFK